MTRRRSTVLVLVLVLVVLCAGVAAVAILVARPDVPVPASVVALVPAARILAVDRAGMPGLPTRLAAAWCRSGDRSVVLEFEPLGLPLEMLRSHVWSSLPPPYEVPDPAVGIVGLTEAEFQAWRAETPSAPCE